jgi:conjugative transfer signal peptidase TraF
VVIGSSGITIDGRLQAHSAPRPRDAAKRALPQLAFDHRLSKDQLVVMGDTPDSFDSRYFGPIRRDQVLTVVRPLITW